MYLHDNITGLPLKREYEIDEKNIEIIHEKELGKGHYGCVKEGAFNISGQWMARGFIKNLFRRDKILPVAVKVASTDENVREEAKKMLEGEIRLMCAVPPHPHNVTLIGYVKTQENLLVVLEKCGFKSLLELLRQRRPQSEKRTTEQRKECSDGYLRDVPVVEEVPIVEPLPSEAYVRKDPTELMKILTTDHLLSFAWQVAKGMQHLSDCKCVHRDLAARNILVTSAGVCKVSDFGLARNIVDKNYYRINGEYDIPIRWMAPEAKKATTMSDVWSYGVVLYEIFTLGSLPYEDYDPEVNEGVPIEQAIANGLRCPKPENASDEIYELMRKCWDATPENRPKFRAVRDNRDDAYEDDLCDKFRTLFKENSPNYFDVVVMAIKQEHEKQKYIADLRRENAKEVFPDYSRNDYYRLVGDPNS